MYLIGFVIIDNQVHCSVVLALKYPLFLHITTATITMIRTAAARQPRMIPTSLAVVSGPPPQ